ncbi:MAG: hypothetical protein CMF52_05915 [Legionellales bacterium]|nr:hypothetical protein [Legionellales bacterium]
MPPEHFVRELSRSAGASLDFTYPKDTTDIWWGIFRQYVVLIPGRDIGLRHNAPAEIVDLISSRMVQQLIREKLEERGSFVVYDNGVDSAILYSIEFIVTEYGSVDAFLEAGHQLPNADYEEALRLLFAGDQGDNINMIGLVRFPTPRPDGDADITITLPITFLTAHIVAAICHEMGPSHVREFLENDYSAIGEFPTLFEYFSCSAEVSRAQRITIYTVLMVGHRLSNQKLRGLWLPKEIWLHVLAHIRIDELGRFCFGK